MKSTLTILISLLTFSVFGQSVTSKDTTFHDEDGVKVATFELCHHYKIGTPGIVDSLNVIERVYFKSGQLKAENPYFKNRSHGKRKEWYEDGKIRREIDYQNSRIHGQLITYWENGQLKRRDVYDNGKRIKGEVWDVNGALMEYYNYEIAAQFPGGKNALFDYLAEKIIYPKKSRDEGIEGKVMVTFMVEKDGSISQCQIIRGVNDEINAEALRVIKQMPKWNSRSKDGIAGKQRVSLNVNFTLEGK
ncbi:energy transducer TonB [Flavobacterium sp. UBA7682]|uniref:energy transducer TonB n=1 Tax=Flavobacterium sp. UBA7682 TaxID=1946560 RepID=UPI0025B92617|nr:energy transducer TonB [Flavobacterium sp. UBA7682]